MGPQILTSFRPAELHDIPHCVCLGEMEYEQIFNTTEGFSADFCENFIFDSIGRGDRFNYVLVDKTDIPFGYIAGGLNNLYMTDMPEAVVYHWFVNNPNGMYGKTNYGKEMIKFFEQWAKHRGARSIVVSYMQKQGQERYLNRVFSKMGYQLNTVNYRKEL